MAPTLLAAACGGTPTGSSGVVTVVDQIVLTCPSDVRTDTSAGSPAAVSFPAPTASGGVPPISIACVPASGSTFQMGDTPVACSGTDGVRYAACSFKVTVTQH